jgi:D-arginine dehydrogenase
MINQQFDVIVIGAGIAGVSLGATISATCRTAVLDMEANPGFHATGRSAAYFAPAYGNDVIRALTTASTQTYKAADLFAHQVIRRRSALFVGREEQLESIVAMHTEQPDLTRLNANDLKQQVPIFQDHMHHGLLDDSGGDLDVDAILQGYLKLLRNNGGELITAAKVQSLETKNTWQVGTSRGTFSAPIIVNAAGAWADGIAATAGLQPIGLTPMRRTALLVDPPSEQDISYWPLVVDVDENFYFKPDAGKLLLSPADETPSEPMDAHANEFDVAVAIDRVSAAIQLDVKRVNHQWAGLRTFANDKSPVVGFDPRKQGFFWLAGQGGYGVQTAPGLARLASDLLLGSSPGTELSHLINRVHPERLIRG